ncbi:MAG: ATP-binding protein [Syntrophales bacterium]|nr:ATP-binding protein [Syntrophales bacterium]
MHELTVQLEHYLKVLRLPGILMHYQDLADQATQKKLHYHEYLTLVLEAEVKRKQEASVKTKITTARFPYPESVALSVLDVCDGEKLPLGRAICR